MFFKKKNNESFQKERKITGGEGAGRNGRRENLVPSTSLWQSLALYVEDS